MKNDQRGTITIPSLGQNTDTLKLGPMQKIPNFAKEADLEKSEFTTNKINCNEAMIEQKSVGYHLVPPKPHTSKSSIGRKNKIE